MLNSLGNSIESVLEFSLPMVILSVIIAVSLRIADIIKNKRKIVLYKEVLALFFMIYILCFNLSTASFFIFFKVLSS